MKLIANMVQLEQKCYMVQLEQSHLTLKLKYGKVKRCDDELSQWL